MSLDRARSPRPCRPWSGPGGRRLPSRPRALLSDRRSEAARARRSSRRRRRLRLDERHRGGEEAGWARPHCDVLPREVNLRGASGSVTMAAVTPPDLRARRRFHRRLLAWYARHGRDLPWRKTRDPYRILVSEIMLQQTRAQAVIPYYEEFLARFPSARDLAEAEESEILRRWSGLGYYQRARNLQRAARQIVELGGFPREYDAIRDLPGVGPYTAA